MIVAGALLVTCSLKVRCVLTGWPGVCTQCHSLARATLLLLSTSLQSSEAAQFNTFLKEFKDSMQGKGKADFFDEMVKG